MKSATKEQANEFADYMTSRFGGKIVPRSVVSSALNALIHFDPTQLIRANAVTLGPIVFVDEDLPYDEYMAVIVHECSHLESFWKNPVEFYFLYIADSDDRVREECRAYHAQLELTYARTKVLPSLDTLAMPLESGYLLSDKDIALGRSLLEQAATSVVSGVQSTEAGRAAIEFLEDRHPELLTV